MRAVAERLRIWPSPSALLQQHVAHADREFLAPALEILETPPSPVQVGLIWAIVSLFTIAIAWAGLGTLDIVAVAQGKFQPTGRVKIVEPLDSGRVAAVHVTNGVHVEAGEALIEFDRSAAEAEQKAALAQLHSLDAEVARRMAGLRLVHSGSYDPVPAVRCSGSCPEDIREREQRVLVADMAQLRASLAALVAQRAQRESERTQVDRTIQAQRALVRTLQDRVDMRSQLLRSHAGAKASVIDATETLQLQQMQLTTQEGQLASATAAIEVIEREKDKVLRSFTSDYSQKVQEAERLLEDARQRLVKAQAQLDHMTLRAPIAGSVQASVVTNPGQVLSAGQQVMRIVPDDVELEIEAYVQNRDIAFVHVGQEAVIKVESLPFTQYGTLGARIVSIGKDAIPEPDATATEGDPAHATASSTFAGAQRTQNLVFPVILRPDADRLDIDGGTIRMSAGMAAGVEIRTGKRSILGYLFSPLIEVGRSAFHER